ncbi:hypothetical protein V8G54_029699, partial [Vigna mungo]
MEDGIGGTGFDVLGVVVVHATLNCSLYVTQRQHRFHVLWNLAQLLSPYLVEESPHRHGLALQQTLADFPIAILDSIAKLGGVCALMNDRVCPRVAGDPARPVKWAGRYDGGRVIRTYI